MNENLLPARWPGPFDRTPRYFGKLRPLPAGARIAGDYFIAGMGVDVYPAPPDEGGALPSPLAMNAPVRVAPSFRGFPRSGCWYEVIRPHDGPPRANADYHVAYWQLLGVGEWTLRAHFKNDGVGNYDGVRQKVLFGAQGTWRLPFDVIEGETFGAQWSQDGVTPYGVVAACPGGG